jgi:hypothetical protein
LNYLESESNNSISEANLVPIGSTVSANLPSQDVDFFKYQVSASGILRFSVDLPATSGAKWEFKILNSTGAIVNQFTGWGGARPSTETIDHIVSPGTYYLSVTPVFTSSSMYSVTTSISSTTSIPVVTTPVTTTPVDTRDTTSNVVMTSNFAQKQAELLASLKYNNPFSSPSSSETSQLGSGAWGHYGTKNADVLVGTDSTDFMFGQAGNDNISGGKGNDFIYPGEGGAFGDGGEGIDTLVFDKALSSYVIYPQSYPKSGGVIYLSIITKDLSLPVEVSTFDSIERIQFSDTNVALDTGKDQTAGSGYMLYKAAFNRTPDAGGLGYWISKMDSGMGYSDVAKNFVNSAEFKTAFGGSNPSVNTLVTKLYNNVLNRTPDAGGLAFWQEKLNTGWSTADVLGYFSTSAENVTNVTPLIANGISYTQYAG